MSERSDKFAVFAKGSRQADPFGAFGDPFGDPFGPFGLPLRPLKSCCAGSTADTPRW